VHGCRDALADAQGVGRLAQLTQTGRAEIQRLHGETLLGEKQRIAAMARSQLEHVVGARVPEDCSGVDGRGGGLTAVHAGIVGVGGVPVPSLRVWVSRHELDVSG
jgi:hypothetical protein